MTLEQDRFKLRGSTYTDLFNKHSTINVFYDFVYSSSLICKKIVCNTYNIQNVC